MVVIGLLYHAMITCLSYGNESISFLDSVVGAMFGFGILLALYLQGGIGGGDVKLMTGIGAWLGIKKTFMVFTAASIMTGVYAIVALIATGRLINALFNVYRLCIGCEITPKQDDDCDRLEKEIARSDRYLRVIPFAAMIALGIVYLFIMSR